MEKHRHLPLRHHGLKVLDLIQKAITETDPAWFLYRNKVRAPLFMVESLTRVLVSLKDKSMSGPGKRIKKLEDMLGKIEDYDCFYQAFSGNKNIKKLEKNYFLQKRKKVTNKLNKRLIKKDFYQKTLRRLSGEKSPDLNSKICIKALEAQLPKEIQACLEFYMEFPEGFNSMETEVHEIRRKLRWISIYAQSFDGIVVLKPDHVRHRWEKEFIVPEEKDSPYHKLLFNPGLERYICFNEKAFRALNHVIKVLGEIKDKGLEIEFLARAIRKYRGLSEQESITLAAKQLKVTYDLEDLFDQAHRLLHTFFIKYRIHEMLIIS